MRHSLPTLELSEQTARPASPAAPAASAAPRSCPQCGAGLQWPDYADVAVCASCGSTLAADTGLRALQCPQCAGPLAAVGGTRLLGCCHCGVQILVRSRGGYDRFHLPLRVDGQAAQQVARNWLRQRAGVARRARASLFTRVELVYVPIWEYSALVAGWEFGHTLRMRGEYVGESDSPRMELQPVREPVRDGHLKERRFYDTAADLTSLGATRPRITGREPLLPLVAGDLEEGRVLPHGGDEEELQARGRARVLRPVSGAEGLCSRLFVLHESVALLFYPLWILEDERGSSGGCRVVVNAYEASVNAALAPASLWWQTRERAAAAAPLLGVAALLTVLAVLSARARVAAAVAVALLVLVGVTVFIRSRAEAEVDYHDPLSS